MPKLTLGSLFSGIGGFELAAQMYGIEPVWASEIEEAPIRITKRHFPNMKHIGDITKIDGGKIDPVDIISGGSPCQSLSVAGKQAGISRICQDCGFSISANSDVFICPECGAELELTRSGLFVEQIRIIKEMREATNNKFPQVILWENVCFAEDTLVTCDTGMKRICDVHIGDKVKTMSGNYHTVAKCHKTKHQKVLVLDVRGALPITVTPNHPFYVRYKSHNTHGVRQISDPQWLPAGELTTNHMVGFRIDKPTLPNDFISEIDAWILGRWLADGSIDTNRSNPRIFISVGNDKIESVREKLKNSSYDVYENRVHATAINFTFTSRSFYNYIVDANVGAGNKRVPSYVFNLPYHLQQLVLDGYISGDGHIRYHGNSVEVQAGTASEQLVYGIARLVRNCHHVGVGISKHEIKTPPKINGRILKVNYPTYSINYCLTQAAATTFFDGEFVWQMVKSVTPLSKKATVYNLSVLEDNTYEVNTVICHNCGALSSNNGDDFYCVLREFAGLFGEELPTFRPKQWTKAGELLGKSGSLAWRTLDAQYWGVPQRRRRIFLVTDLGGQRAREVLFKPESLRRHTPKGEIPWKRTSEKTESGTKKTSIPDVAETTTYGFEPGASARLKGDRLWPELSGTLRAQMGDNQMSVLTDDKSKEPEVYGICSMGSNSMKSNNPNSGFYKADVAKTLDTTGTDPTCNQGGNVVVQEPVYCIQGNCIDRADTAGCNGKGWKEDVSYTLTTIDRPAVAYAVHSVRENGSGDVWLADVSSTLTTGGDKIGQGYSGVLIEALEPPSEKSSAAFAYQVGPKNPYFPYNEELSPKLVANQKMGVLIENHPADSRVKISDDGICQTLSARMGTGGGNVPLVMEQPALCATTGYFMGCDEEVVPTLLARDYKDPKIVLKGNKGVDCYATTTRNQILCILSKTYGAQAVVEWGIAVLAALQQASVLQQSVSECVCEIEAETWQKLDDSTLPCPKFIADRLLRNMREHEECGCTPQRLQSSEQQCRKPSKTLPKLSQQDTPTPSELFHMWEKGEGIWLLREALSEVQKVWKSSCGEKRESNSVVRRLTPLEAERLQGFPDNWTYPESDAARYKALGNSVAVPCVAYIMSGIADVLDPIE